MTFFDRFMIALVVILLTVAVVLQVVTLDTAEKINSKPCFDVGTSRK